jgi:ABC-type multidrug transport system fused ATPase/permease subunit
LIATSLAFSAVVSTSLGLTRTISPGMLGLSLTYCLTVVNNLNDLIGSVSETEQEMVSVERIAEYIDIPSEHKGDEDRKKLEKDLQFNVDDDRIGRHINTDFSVNSSSTTVNNEKIIKSRFFSIESLGNRIFGRAQKLKRVKRNPAHMDPDGLRRPLIDLEENADLDILTINKNSRNVEKEESFESRKKMNRNIKTNMMNYIPEDTVIKHQIKGGHVVFKNVFLFYNQKSPSSLAALSNLSMKIPMVSTHIRI